VPPWSWFSLLRRRRRKKNIRPAMMATAPTAQMATPALAPLERPLEVVDWLVPAPLVAVLVAEEEVLVAEPV